jgi:hypothetical protein
MTDVKIAVLALLVGLPFATAGCKGDDDKSKSAGSSTGSVTAKQAPANPGDAPQAASGPLPTTQPAASGAGGRQSLDGMSFELPAGWSQNQNNPVRLATLTDGTAEIAVNAFPGNVGGTLMNVNRWRGQVGLPAVASEAEAKKDIREMVVNGTKVQVVDLTGSSRMLVAVVPVRDKLYFFKLAGSADVVAARKDAFDRFVQSIKVE